LEIPKSGLARSFNRTARRGGDTPGVLQGGNATLGNVTPAWGGHVGIALGGPTPYTYKFSVS